MDRKCDNDYMFYHMKRNCNFEDLADEMIILALDWNWTICDIGFVKPFINVLEREWSAWR